MYEIMKSKPKKPSNNAWIGRDEAEIRDLDKYWSKLSWRERDNITSIVLESLNTLAFAQVSADEKERINALQEACNALWDANERPSKIARMLHIVPEVGFKPRYRVCISIIMDLGYEELVALGKNLQIEGIESFQGSVDDLRRYYINLGAHGTLATFYALRNALGKRAASH
ncbi:hypothetical protein [Methanoculleus horonobensis]|uniref:hypothetical protein n=1 Tax=Methanoculleus horonobensis TaxID=528314 RepID=UPI001290685A|nr:hypothetical protein [Methanoculleus horonobensis]